MEPTDFCLFNPESEMYFWTLMQFTGLKDKNGREIYQSDLLLKEDGRICEVTWFSSPLLCGWDLEAKNVKGNPPGISLWDSFQNWEVIGNIYENPDLLK
jgi:hypothetical protein